MFDLGFSELRGKSASDLWKDVINSQAQNGKNDIRGEKLFALVDYPELMELYNPAAEQKITPWEEDSAVSQCPLCL